ncbi:MAG: zinc ribbon domain-containing protein [Candidatus Humimicrobiaceae bacterium]
MFCKECGKEIEDDSKFCKYCGFIISSGQSNNIDYSVEPAEAISVQNIKKNNIYCPLYHHIDNISKVSAVYSSGVSEGRYSGTAISYIAPFSSNESSSIAVTPVSMGGFNITDLSRRLAPPPQPMYPSQALFVVFLILACLSFPLCFLFGIGIPFLAILVPLTVWQGTKNSNKTKETKEYLPIYEKAMLRWNKLYYCFRDDIVFDPETNEHVSADKINDLICKDFYIQKEISENKQISE